MPEMLVQYVPDYLPESILNERDVARRLALYARWERDLRLALRNELAQRAVTVEELAGIGALVIRGTEGVLRELNAPGGILERFHARPVVEHKFAAHAVR